MPEVCVRGLWCGWRACVSLARFWHIQVIGQSYWPNKGSLELRAVHVSRLEMLVRSDEPRALALRPISIVGGPTHLGFVGRSSRKDTRVLRIASRPSRSRVRRAETPPGSLFVRHKETACAKDRRGLLQERSVIAYLDVRHGCQDAFFHFCLFNSP